MPLRVGSNKERVCFSFSIFVRRAAATSVLPGQRLPSGASAKKAWNGKSRRTEPRGKAPPPPAAACGRMGRMGGFGKGQLGCWLGFGSRVGVGFGRLGFGCQRSHFSIIRSKQPYDVGKINRTL